MHYILYSETNNIEVHRIRFRAGLRDGMKMNCEICVITEVHSGLETELLSESVCFFIVGKKKKKDKQRKKPESCLLDSIKLIQNAILNSSQNLLLQKYKMFCPGQLKVSLHFTFTLHFLASRWKVKNDHPNPVLSCLFF